MTLMKARRSLATVSVVLFASSVAGCWNGTDRTPVGSNASAGTTCVSYSDEVEELSWSADGDWLAIRSITKGADFEHVSLLRWPTLEKVIVADGDPHEVLQPLTPAEDSRTIYVWFTHDGQRGIWRLQKGVPPMMLGNAHNDRVAGALFWTPDGIIITTASPETPEWVTWSLVGWDGQEVVLRPQTAENAGEWASGDGQWIVAGEGEPHQTSIVVHHAGVATRLNSAVEASPVGMTPAKDAVVSHAFGDDRSTMTQLVLHILPLSKTAERTIVVGLATQGLGNFALSSQGVLAYTGFINQRDRICLVHLDFGAAK